MFINVGLESNVIHPMVAKVETLGMAMDYYFMNFQRRRPSNRDNSAITG